MTTRGTPGTGAIEHEVWIEADRETVFDALTTAAGT